MNASSSGRASSHKIVTTNSAAEVKRDVSAPKVSSAPREGHRIDPQKTNRIGGLIGREKPAAATVEKQPAVSSSNFTGEGGRADPPRSVADWQKKSSAHRIDKHTSAEIGGPPKTSWRDGGRKPSDHMYMDCHQRICHRIIWPSYRYLVHYNWGPYGTFRYVYPYYHRKYIFVSLCGYWPVEYTCARYYWYGYHPYAWYGYYPIPYEVQGDTYNYYTYNSYYDNEPAASTTTTTAWPTQTENYIRPVDSNTFADVREKLARQTAAQPDQATLADTYFEEGVKVFEVNDFNAAAVKFAKAMELAPDDMVLPFAYAQALFADGQYTESAQVLRAALVKVSPDKEGVFYPRGLYSGDDILFEQVIRLSEKAEVFSFDADLQLLLGYQLLGLGEVDEASEPLLRAGEDLQNASAAAVLLKLQEKIKANGAVQGAKQ